MIEVPRENLRGIYAANSPPLFILKSVPSLEREGKPEGRGELRQKQGAEIVP
jgi:hypothetical protein